MNLLMITIILILADTMNTTLIRVLTVDLVVLYLANRMNILVDPLLAWVEERIDELSWTTFLAL